MHAEHWRTENSELEGYAVKVSSYQLGDAHITEVESIDSGSMIARAVDERAEESRSKALESASRRLLWTRDLNLTVDG
jgi:hypothetical protein